MGHYAFCTDCLTVCPCEGDGVLCASSVCGCGRKEWRSRTVWFSLERVVRRVPLNDHNDSTAAVMNKEPALSKQFSPQFVTSIKWRIVWAWHLIGACDDQTKNWRQLTSTKPHPHPSMILQPIGLPRFAKTEPHTEVSSKPRGRILDVQNVYGQCMKVAF